MPVTNIAVNKYIYLFFKILQKETCKKVEILSSCWASSSETPKESWIATVLPSELILFQKR